MLSIYETAPQILFKDNFITAVYKPRCIHSVSKSKDGIDETDIEHWLYKSGQPQTLKEAGLVQRLDFYTSGCLLAANSEDTQEKLRLVFKSESVDKTYLALVEGNFKSDRKLATWIGSPYRRSKKVKVVEGERCPPRFLKAESEIYSYLYLPEQNLSLVKVSAPIARRHQVRAHLAHLKHPLIGDSSYGSARLLSEVFPGTEGFFLHAFSLGFIHPENGKTISIEASLPPEVNDLF